MIWISDFQPESSAVDLEPGWTIGTIYILNVGSTGLISGVVGPPINGLMNGFSPLG